MLLEKSLPPEVNLLKVDVPSDATKDTPWQITRLSRQRYFEPVPPQRDSWDKSAIVTYKEAAQLDQEAEDTDVYVLRRKRMVAVTPLTLDMTAPVKLADFEKFLRE
jgi:5'-nucleotidase